MIDESLKVFLQTIQTSKNKMSQDAIRLLETFILKSNCKFIRFDSMSQKALGISKTDECVLSTALLGIQIEYMLYVILHEVSHQYQYKKHGKNVALNVYIDTVEDIEQATQRLLWLESSADRLALMKLKHILFANKTKLSVEIKPRYLHLTNTDYLKKYITELRQEVKNLNLSSIEEINNHIHNKIKPL